MGTTAANGSAARLRILFLIHRLSYGGAERQLIALAKALHQRGHEVAVAPFYAGGSLLADLEAAGVPVCCLGKRRPGDLLGVLWRLHRLIQERQPDILHPYLEGANLLSLAMRPFFPNLQIVWGVRASEMDLSRYRWRTALSYRLNGPLARFAHLIISNSQAGREDAQKQGFPANRLVVVPNGIDTQRFRPDAVARQRIRAEWGIGEKEILIGRVGRFDPMKDYPTFLRAAALLAASRSDLRFVCVGDGSKESRAELEAVYREGGLEGCLIWAGARSDMPAVYSGLDVLVSSSAYGEGFPNVLGEAMACGTPCVATDVGDSALVLGDCGVVVPPKSPLALAEGCCALLGRGLAEEGRRGRERIVAQFSLERLVERSEAALRFEVAAAVP